MPRSILAVPLIDDEDSLGVLEILDRRSGEGFGLRDVELAGVFARQATVAIRATRSSATPRRCCVTGCAPLLPRRRCPFPRSPGGARRGGDAQMGSDDDPLWTLADRVGRLRAADPGQVALLADLLDVLIRRAERQRPGRTER